MLCVTAKLCILVTAIFSRLMEFLGNISTADVSSTNLVRKCQSTNRLFVITAKRTTPNLVPWGIPPQGVYHLGYTTIWVKFLQPLLPAYDQPKRQRIKFHKLTEVIYLGYMLTFESCCGGIKVTSYYHKGIWLLRQNQI